MGRKKSRSVFQFCVCTEIFWFQLFIERPKSNRSTMLDHQPQTSYLCPQITEMSTELADERNTGESASQLLEAETSERLRLEKDMKELQVKQISCFVHGPLPVCVVMVTIHLLFSIRQSMIARRNRWRPWRWRSWRLDLSGLLNSMERWMMTTQVRYRHTATFPQHSRIQLLIY